MKEREIIISKYCGFCSGVKRCISLVEKELKVNKNVYSTGELLHNSYEMQRLQSLGLKVILDINQLQNLNEEVVLIVRTHGIERHIYNTLSKMKNLKVIDGTCPIVKRLQQIVEEYSNKGYNVIIFGSDEHPEIKALVTYINKDVEYAIVDSEEKIDEINISQPIVLVSQTTKQQKEYEQIIKILRKKYKKLKVFDTVCKETILREKSAEKIAKKVDLMLVVGSKNSSNTKKLKDISKMNNDRVFLIEDEKELSNLDISSYNKIGIISGSSTPMWLVEKIVKTINLVNCQ